MKREIQTITGAAFLTLGFAAGVCYYINKESTPSGIMVIERKYSGSIEQIIEEPATYETEQDETEQNEIEHDSDSPLTPREREISKRHGKEMDTFVLAYSLSEQMQPQMEFVMETCYPRILKIELECGLNKEEVLNRNKLFRNALIEVKTYRYYFEKNDEDYVRREISRDFYHKKLMNQNGAITDIKRMNEMDKMVETVVKFVYSGSVEGIENVDKREIDFIVSHIEEYRAKYARELEDRKKHAEEEVLLIETEVFKY